MSNALPDKFMAWHNRPTLDHTGTWATTRYPDDAEEYVKVAALPGLVKPLQWEDHPKADGPVLSQAFVQGGGYFICDDTDDFTGAYLEFVSCDDVRWWQHVRSTSVELQGRFHEEDITPLKAAAQAHHVAQIMAAFGIDGEST